MAIVTGRDLGEAWGRAVVARSPTTPTQDLLTPYQSEQGIVNFVTDILGVVPHPYQADILRALWRYKRVSVRGPHGLGKTAIASWVVLWGMTVYPEDTKAPTTASVWRQLTKFLWPEINKWAKKGQWDKLGVSIRENQELLDLSLKLPNGREAFAVASNNASAIEGAHAKHLVYVFDEAKAIPDANFDAAEGAFSQAGDDTDNVAFALAVSTPGSPSGRFYEIHQKNPRYKSWHAIHVTKEQAIAAGAISAQWVQDRADSWGINSPVYQNRVEGNFSNYGDDVVVPLQWVDAARARYDMLVDKGAIRLDTPPLSYGVDPARKGQDKTAICTNYGAWVTVQYFSQLSTMETAGRVAMMLGGASLTPVAVDTIGLGAGVYDRLAELNYYVIEGNASEATTLTDKSGKIGFINLRSALWWMIREALDPDGPAPLALPDDDKLYRDLVTPKFKITSRGAIQVESKDDIRGRLDGESTDGADALALALYARIAQTASIAEWW